MLKELAAGRVRVLGVSAPERLAGALSDAPTWSEQGIDCVIGAWRGVSGPAGLDDAQVKFWADVVSTATAQPSWREELTRLAWSPMLLTGADLRVYLTRERAEFVTTLGELGLLKRA